jgi:hypothetical protein
MWSHLFVVPPLQIPIPMCEKKMQVQQENSYKITYGLLKACCTSNDANQWPGGTGKMETETGLCFREKNEGPLPKN